jgi:hypothetical protein
MTYDMPPSSLPPHVAGVEPLLAVACPSCHGALAVTTVLAGEAAQCPLCANGFLVPVPLPPVAAPLEQPPQPRGELEFAEPVPTTIAGAEGVIELRRLTPEEKAARRSRRNAIMLLTGVSILMMIVLLLGTKKK